MATPSPSPPPASIVPTASPSALPTPTPAPTPRTYVVQPNDTLNKIAGLFLTTAQAIADANGIAVNATINVGQRLIIP